MNIQGIAGSAMDDHLSMLEEMQYKKSERQADEPLAPKVADAFTAATSASAPANAHGVSSGNVMSSNFTHEGSRVSKYIDANVASLEQLIQMKRAMSGQIMAQADEYGGVDGGTRAQLQRSKMYKTGDNAMEENRDELDKKTAEAMAPKDENGEPIPGSVPGEGAAAAAQATAEQSAPNTADAAAKAAVDAALDAPTAANVAQAAVNIVV